MRNRGSRVATGDGSARAAGPESPSLERVEPQPVFPPVRRLGPLPLLAATLAALATLSRHLPAPVAVALIAPTFGVVPGWIFTRHLAPRAGPARKLLFSLVLSPLLVGGPAAILLARGVPPGVVASGACWVLVALSLVAVRRSGEADEPEGAVPWIAGAAWAAVVALFFVGDAGLLTRGESWFHAAIVMQVAERGLPLENPFFAGLRLVYYWGYHVRAALWLALCPALAPWTPLLSPQVAGAFATPLGVALLAQRLGAAPRARLLAVALALFGYAPFGWVWLLARAATSSAGAAAGWHALVGHGFEPILAALDPGTPHPSMAFFGERHLVPGPFALAAAAFLACVLALLDVIEVPRRRSLVLLALLLASALFLQSVVGWAACLIGAGWAVWTLARSRRTWEQHLRRPMLGVAIAAVAALVLLYPYLVATSGGTSPGLTWGLDGAALRTWLLAGGLFVAPAAIWLSRRASAPGPERELWGFSIAMTAGALLLGLPAAPRGQLFSLLFLLLAAPAALKFQLWLEDERPARRAAWAAFLLLAVLPTTALGLWGFASEARQSSRVSEAPRSEWLRQAYEWAASHTAPDAVFVDPEERLGMAVVAGRSALWGGERWAGAWEEGAAGLEARRRAVSELSAGRESPRTIAFLRSLGRPIVLVRRKPPYAAPGAAPVAPSPERWTRIFENDGVILYRWNEAP